MTDLQIRDLITFNRKIEEVAISLITEPYPVSTNEIVVKSQLGQVLPHSHVPMPFIHDLPAYRSTLAAD